MEFRNALWLEDGRIDCEIEHPALGWIPYTATSESDIWLALMASDVAPYTPSSEADVRAAWRVNAHVPRTTFVRNCRKAGILSDEEAPAASKGEWPQSFADALDALPVEIDPVDAQIVWGGLTEVYRRDPVLIALQLHLGLSPEQVDALFGMPPPSEEASSDPEPEPEPVVVDEPEPEEPVVEPEMPAEDPSAPDPVVEPEELPVEPEAPAEEPSEPQPDMAPEPDPETPSDPVGEPAAPEGTDPSPDDDPTP